MNIFLLSCAKAEHGGGIYKYKLTSEGKFDFIKYFPCDFPMYAVKTDDKLYVLLRKEFNIGNSGYFSIDCDLNNSSSIKDTKGKVACHLAVNENNNYIVNYISGNVVKNCSSVVTHKGKSVNPLRQQEPHTHCAVLSHDKNIAVCDLGIDTLFVYDNDLKLISKAKTPEGLGIRHCVFSKDSNYIYSINELIPSISVFSYKKGIVNYINTYFLQCKNEKANGAAIRLSENGNLLYCSVREENALYIYSVNGPDLQFLQKNYCGGDSPRDFNLFGDVLICTNEKSDNVAVFKLKDGKIIQLIQNITIKAPLCVVI